VRTTKRDIEAENIRLAEAIARLVSEWETSRDIRAAMEDARRVALESFERRAKGGGS
jgi:hypothetical protein